MTNARRQELARRLETAMYSLFATMVVALALALPALMWSGCSRDVSAESTPSADAASADVVPASNGAPAAGTKIERGQYMVTIGGCNDCHTPMKEGPKGPEWDMSRMLSGHPESFPVDNVLTGKEGFIAARTGTAFTGPWGTSFAMNLTPDSLTGIGTWTEKMFVETIRTGKHWGHGRQIMPPMPWFNYAKLTDEDISSVYAYLRTVPPVVNNVPQYRPPQQPVAAK